MTAFLVLLYAYTLSQFYRAFLAVISGDLAREVGLDAAQLGAVSAAWFAAFALAQFPVGIALDRYGPRRTLAILTLVAVGGAAWLSVARSYAECLGAMALIGIGCAPVLMASMYLFGRLYAPGRFALLSSTLIGLGSIGNLLGATPLALAVAAFGWRPSMLAMAGFTAVSAALAAFALRDPPPVASTPGESSVWRGLGTILRTRALWLLMPVVATSYAFPIATRSLWIAPFLGGVYDLDIAGRGHAALAMGLAMSLGALAFGPLDRVFGPKPVVVAGVAASAAGFVALGFWGDAGLGLAIALLAAVGFAGTTYAILMTHARAFFPDALLGRGVTVMNFAFIGGAGMVQWLSGRFVQAAGEAGLPPAVIFERLYLAFGLILLAALAVYLLAPTRPTAAAATLPAHVP